MRSRLSPVHRPLLAAACLLALGAGPAEAKDESKIMLRMEPLAHADDVGRVQSFMWDGRARLDLQVRRLEPAMEHVLALDDGTELARFTTSSEGHANLRVDLLQSGTLSSPPIDPRGHELFVSDPSGDVLSAWLYGAIADDPHWVHIKEWTDLEPSPLATTGSVLARYQLNPSGKPRFVLQPRHIPAGDYDVYVNSVLVAGFTPNSAGNGYLDFRTNTKGFSAAMKPGASDKVKHNRKLSLDFDPRDQLIELMQGTDVYFSGIMRAEIDGVNECSASASEIAMVAADPLSTAVGMVTLGADDDCDRELEVEIEGVPAGTYDVTVDGAPVGQIVVASDGAAASLTFGSDPDEAAGELPLSFAFSNGSVIQVKQAGAVVLGATLP